MIHKRKRNILVVTPVTTHPQNAGNRARIYSMLKELQDIGYAVHVLYDGSEVSSGHVKKRHHIHAMGKQWDSFWYVPNMISAKIWRKRFETNNKAYERFLSLLLHAAYIIPSRRMVGERIDACSGRVGKVVRKTLPFVYRMIKPRFPDGKFISGGLDAQDVDSLYTQRIDHMVQTLSAHARFQVVLAEYVFTSKALEYFDESVRKVIDTHDVFSGRRHKYESEGLKDFSFSTSAFQEARGLARADVVIAIQDDEKKYLETLTDAPVMTVGHHVSIMNNLDKPAYKTLLFVGTANPANIHAMEYFTKRIWPKVFENVPDADLLVVGKVSKHIRAGKGIVRAGEVKDLRKVYEQAYLVINPTAVGTGLKIKSVEALGYGKPIVSSPHAAQGLEYMQGAVVTAADDERWVRILTELLLDEKTVANMSRHALFKAQENNKRVQSMIRRAFGGGLPKYEFRLVPEKKKKTDHFMIFTWPRSGATTLTRVLEEHPDVIVADEPFNHLIGERFSPNDTKNLLTHMQKIRNEYAGTKHNWGLTFQQNMKILSSGDPIIFLTRQNALQRVVSEMIAEQTKRWNSTKKDREETLEAILDPLDPEEVRKRVNEYVWEKEQYKRFLNKQGIAHHELSYEDLYGASVSHRQKIERIKEILAFIGKDKNRFETNATIRTLLNPDITKANSEETYRSIPNIEEIEEILGNDDTGWLFED